MGNIKKSKAPLVTYPARIYNHMKEEKWIWELQLNDLIIDKYKRRVYYIEEEDKEFSFSRVYYFEDIKNKVFSYIRKDSRERVFNKFTVLKREYIKTA